MKVFHFSIILEKADRKMRGVDWDCFLEIKLKYVDI